MIYGSEYWALNKKKTIQIKVAGMRMLTSECVIWLGWIELKMNLLEGVLEQTNIAEKMTDNRIRLNLI